MGSYLWNKSIAISAALAAAGVLACAAALLNAVMPRGSLAAFLASMTLLGLAVTGAAIGYAWLCEKSERYFDGRFDRLLSGGTPHRNAAVGPKTETCGPQVKISVPLRSSQSVGANRVVVHA